MISDDTTYSDLLIPILQCAQRGAIALSRATSFQKNEALKHIAVALIEYADLILSANQVDIKFAIKENLSDALLDRLRLDHEGIASMANAILEIVQLPDPVGKVTDAWARPNGLLIEQKTIPIGVIGIIYEARPNVSSDAASLCFKSGNGVVLKGGSYAIHSNRAIVDIIQEALKDCDLPKYADEAIQFINYTDREIVRALLSYDNYIDLVIPRGGKELVRFVNTHARMPVIKHDEGVCHVVVDGSATPDIVDSVVLNSKTHRTGVCNAAETILFLENAITHLPRTLKKLSEAGVKIWGCEKTKQLASGLDILPATDAHFATEFLGMEVSVKVVHGIAEAAAHIETFGSRHTEAILTESNEVAEDFLNRVNSSCVIVNASTRFADGNQLGLGAEIGISTTRIHAYGPMGLRELTTKKFIVRGSGQIRE